MGNETNQNNVGSGPSEYHEGFTDAPTYWSDVPTTGPHASPSPSPPPPYASGAQYPSAGGYPSGQPGAYTTAPIHPTGETTGATLVAPAKRNTPMVLAISILVTAAVIVAALVYYFTKPKETAPEIQTLPNASTSAVPGPQNGAAPSSQAPATFPGDATTECRDGDNSSSSPLPDIVQRSANNVTASCVFLTEAAQQAERVMPRDAGDASYRMDVYSPTVKKTYSFTCERRAHLSTCTAKSQNKKNPGDIVLYIKDTLN